MRTQWYLLRTKAGQERRAREHLARIADEVLLPLMRVEMCRWGRMVESVGPLFPCYLFALLDLEHHWTDVCYTRGVRELVRFGLEPAVVPQWIVSEFKQRCASGPLELPKRAFLTGERVIVTADPFRQFEGIFHRYLSGAERVTVLLSLMGGVRAVLPANMVAPAA